MRGVHLAIRATLPSSPTRRYAEDHTRSGQWTVPFAQHRDGAFTLCLSTIPGNLVAVHPHRTGRPHAPQTNPALPPLEAVQLGDLSGLGHARVLSVHSPLLRQLWLLSRPPPTDMLKLGGSLCEPSGQSLAAGKRRCASVPSGQVTDRLRPTGKRQSPARGWKHQAVGLSIHPCTTLGATEPNIRNHRPEAIQLCHHCRTQRIELGRVA